MDLGPFYMALNVTDLAASRAFYEILGFEVFDGDEAENWLMLRNGATKLGLFQDFFERPLLAFHPADVRAVQQRLTAAGVALDAAADEGTTGPAHVQLRDPDGHPILLEQSE